MTVKAWGAYAGDKPLEPLEIARRTVGAHDVQIDIAYCGVCHSDLHQVRAEWAGTQFPCVPGNEIVGRVAAVGEHVIGFEPGDLIGIGCIVDSGTPTTFAIVKPMNIAATAPALRSGGTRLAATIGRLRRTRRG